MGLFSFSKSSGAKLVDKKTEEKATAVSAAELTRVKTDSMLKAVNDLELPIKDLSILLNDDVVTVYGEAQTQVAKELAWGWSSWQLLKQQTNYNNKSREWL